MICTCDGLYERDFTMVVGCESAGTYVIWHTGCYSC
jgi:hypothetical protein